MADHIYSATTTTTTTTTLEATLLDDDEYEELQKYLENADPDEDDNDDDCEGAPSRNKIARKAETAPFINFAVLCNLTSTPEVAVEFCRQQGLLPQSVLCPNCGNVLDKLATFNNKAVKNHTLYFPCHKKMCKSVGNFKVFARKNTFFENQRVSLRTSLFLVYAFVSNFSMKQAKVETYTPGSLVSDNTILRFYHLCREICARAISSETCGKKKMGGPGFTVELDESRFRENSRFTNQSNGKEVKGQWVLGGICRETDECFLNVVENPSEETLLPIILDKIEKGTIIFTDSLKNYSRLTELGYNHRVVDNFVDSKTGASVNRILGTWAAIKRFLPVTVSKRQILSEYLGEYLWRRGRDQTEMFQDFLKEIARQYPGIGIDVPSTSS